MTTRHTLTKVTLTKEQAEQALKLLEAYANSGVSNEVSLACARACAPLREQLKPPKPLKSGQCPHCRSMNTQIDEVFLSGWEATCLSCGEEFWEAEV